MPFSAPVYKLYKCISMLISDGMLLTLTHYKPISTLVEQKEGSKWSQLNM